MSRTGLVVWLVAALAQAQEFPAVVERSTALSFLTREDLREGALMAVDARGDVYVAGSREGPGGGFDVFVTKLSRDDLRVVYTVRAGGSGDDFVRGLAVDDAGEVYLVGATTSADFLWNRATQSEAPSYVLRLNGQGVVWVREVASGFTPTAIAVERGEVYLAGRSEGGGERGSQFLGKLRADGGGFESVTLYGTEGAAVIDLRARRGGGFLVTSGSSFAAAGPGGAAVEFESPVEGMPLGGTTYGDASGEYRVLLTRDVGEGREVWVRRYGPRGEALPSTPLPDLPWRIEAAFTGAQGDLLILASTESLGMATKNPVQGCVPGAQTNQALALVGADGTTRLSSFIHFSARGVVYSPVDGRYYAVGWQSNGSWLGVVRVNPAAAPERAVAASCLAHGATFASTPVSPGALMTLFGSGMGPRDGAVFELQEGRVPLEVAGTKVTVDGIAAPLLYAGERQVNFITPWGTPPDGRPVEVCVEVRGERGCLQAATAAEAPGAFWRGRGSAALNEDGTVNSSENPARRGSVVAVFLTGGGMLSGGVLDGGVAEAARHTSIVTAQYVPPAGTCGPVTGCATTPVEVLYAGSAPGLVWGVTQVNLRVPAEASTSSPFASFSILFGAVAAEARVYVAP
ncbi:MAG: SBBP repeat-containing protein [Bryobacteraceae bacterium]|nr:SBBP repeat-containing protein [Bryobacteraceae bacterium]